MIQRDVYERFAVKLYDSFKKYALWIPALLFFITYILVYLKWGINVSSGDARAYINGAERLLSDLPLVDWRAKRTISYEFIIALNYWLKFGYVGVIITQIIINVFATLALYDLGQRLSGKAAGILAATFYAANPDVVNWAFVVMTESVFTAGLILSCWAFYRLLINPNSIWKLTLVAVLWVFVAFIRPTGWFMLPLFGVLLVIGLLNKHSYKSAIYFSCILVMVSALAIWGPLFAGVIQDDLAQITSSAFNTEYYHFLINGVLMYNTPENHIQMPLADMDADPGLASYLSYIIKHPSDCINLFLHRMFYTTIYSSPNYSAMHNLIINLGIPIMYVLAFIGGIVQKREPLTLLMFSIVVFQLSITCITVGWSGVRYWVYVLPLIMMYSAVGIITLAKLILRRTRSINYSF